MIEIILSCLLSGAFIVSISLIIITSNINLYCKIFKHKDRKLWKKFIREYDNFKYINEVENSKQFISKDNKYSAWIWEDGYCSIHNHKTKGIILGAFDKKMSKKMADKLNSLQTI